MKAGDAAGKGGKGKGGGGYWRTVHGTPVHFSAAGVPDKGPAGAVKALGGGGGGSGGGEGGSGGAIGEVRGKLSRKESLSTDDLVAAGKHVTGGGELTGDERSHLVREYDRHYDAAMASHQAGRGTSHLERVQEARDAIWPGSQNVGFGSLGVQKTDESRRAAEGARYLAPGLSARDLASQQGISVAAAQKGIQAAGTRRGDRAEQERGSSLEVGHNAGLAGESGLTGYRAAKAARDARERGDRGDRGGLPVSPTLGKIKRSEQLDMDEVGAVAGHVRSGGSLKPTEALHVLREAERHRDTETVRDSKGRTFPEDRRRAEEASRVHEDIRKHAVEVARAGGHGQDATAQEILRRYDKKASPASPAPGATSGAFEKHNAGVPTTKEIRRADAAERRREPTIQEQIDRGTLVDARGGHSAPTAAQKAEFDRLQRATEGQRKFEATIPRGHDSSLPPLSSEGREKGTTAAQRAELERLQGSSSAPTAGRAAGRTGGSQGEGHIALLRSEVDAQRQARKEATQDLDYYDRNPGDPKRHAAARERAKQTNRDYLKAKRELEEAERKRGSK